MRTLKILNLHPRDRSDCSTIVLLYYYSTYCHRLIMPFPRASGILLHPTSFPSPYGIGDLGKDAYDFIDFLAESKQRLWQILPLGPAGYGNSPYMSYSAFAGNPLLISPERLKEKGLLSEADLSNYPVFPDESVDFDRVIPAKLALLWQAFQNSDPNASQYHSFCERQSYWLDDFALFMALKEKHNQEPWYEWEDKLKKRKPEALSKEQEDLSDRINFHKFLQFEFFSQWSALRRYAKARDILIIGDIPIYVGGDSADVWANQSVFCLDAETGKPKLKAGVPPDKFEPENGQMWGNPIYNWKQLEMDDFSWWVQRFRTLLDYVDVIRIDHFRGFEAYWEIPGEDSVAKNGRWVEAPGELLFQVVREKLGVLPIIAEDLGVITRKVRALRDRFGFPGMKILQFAFEPLPDLPFLPFNYTTPNCVVYTGTHDNDTTQGWYSKLPDKNKNTVWLYLLGKKRSECDESEIHWEFLRLALSSIANQAIFPLQDVLGLGAEARMNLPGSLGNWWSWRYQRDALTPAISNRLRSLTEIYARTGI
ncbi:4-alpha-glucanotransferase [Kamptonema formosum]|uniref:4-alpha-glucanotransferase n=1 Tax=Kamptonema formosum TaxID=331992 RepID=UPI00034D80AF